MFDVMRGIDRRAAARLCLHVMKDSIVEQECSTVSVSRTVVGFVGIGNMGWPMAANLVSGGFDVVVFDVAAERTEAFVEQCGGRHADTVETLAAEAGVLITMLPSSVQVSSTLSAALPAMVKGALVMEMSSGDPAVTRRLAELAAAQGIDLVDCPVSGGVARARDASLSIMAGGSPSALGRARPLLAHLAGEVHVCGDVGAGQAMKALNNLVSTGGLVVSLEALAIGTRFGLDPRVMVDVLNASTGVNNSTRNKLNQFVLSRSFDSGFGLDLLAKDVTIALDLAGEGESTPLSDLCRDLVLRTQDLLGPGHDHTEIARLVESLTGSDLSAPA